MSISLLLMTHEEVGAAMLNMVKKTFETLPLVPMVVPIPHSTNIDELFPHLEELIRASSSEEGILILTDLYGSTPSNLAMALKKKNEHLRIISGLNLPMLMRVMNYAHSTLDDLAEKALEGGKEGIMDCDH